MAFIEPRPEFERRSSLKARRRRAFVLAGSAISHIVVLGLMFGAAAGQIVSAGGAGGPQGPVFNVSLVGESQLRKSDPDADQGGGTLTPLYAKMKQADEGMAVAFSPTSPSRDFAKLVNRFQRSDVSAQDKRRVDSAALEARSPERVSQWAAKAPTTGKPSEQPTQGETVGSASAGELWGRIEPCWRSLKTPVERPVVLEVTLSAGAGLARPPSVVRDVDARLDEPRLRSEARALQALADCLPRGDLRFARRVYRLEFGVE